MEYEAVEKYCRLRRIDRSRRVFEIRHSQTRQDIGQTYSTRHPSIITKVKLRKTFSTKVNVYVFLELHGIIYMKIVYERHPVRGGGSKLSWNTFCMIRYAAI